MEKLSNSTYSIDYDYSFYGEEFCSVSIHWRSFFKILKIRIANWKPKRDRSNSAIFYFEVKTRQEAKEILSAFKDYDFQEIERYFEEQYTIANSPMTTGLVHEWLDGTFIPDAKKRFKNPLTPTNQN